MAAKVLLRTPNWIGDHVMAVPFYKGLRQLYPKSHITALLPETLWGLEGLTLADETRFFSRSQKRQPFKLAKEFGGFDLALTLPASTSSAFFLFLTGAKTRVGFSEGVLADLFLTSSLKWSPRGSGKHKSDLYLELVEFLGGHFPAGNEETQFERRGPIVVAPGASIALREWPFFAELLISLCQEFPAEKITVVGSSRELKWKTQFKRLNLSNIDDKIGETSLPELLAILKGAGLVIANDSGIAHMAANLAGVPTITILGPGDPEYILPRGSSFVLPSPTISCSPCEKPFCLAPHGYKACLYSISAEDVMREVGKIKGTATQR